MIKEHYEIKTNNNPKEKKEFKKINGDEYLKKMQEEELLRQAKLLLERNLMLIILKN